MPKCVLALFLIAAAAAAAAAAAGVLPRLTVR
jgi:hypothetical protein